MKNTTFLSTLLLAPALLLSASVSASGVLENPQDNSMQSGISMFSGWYCDADKIEIIVDDRPAKTAAYGTPRKDTLGVCGDTDNGFGLLFAFNLYGAGPHTVKALADGVEFDSAQFTVDYLDSSYIRGLDSYVEITVLALGKEATLVWQENMQGYVISNVQDLDFTMEDVLQAAVGTWSGTWQSAWAPGSTLDMTVEAIQIPGGVTLQPTSITINGTGCAAESKQTTPITSFDSMVSEFVMEDGSEGEIEILPANSMTAVAGTFVFDSGTCAGLDGVYTLFKQAP
jgi:hypothetical protein